MELSAEIDPLGIMQKRVRNEVHLMDNDVQYYEHRMVMQGDKQYVLVVLVLASSVSDLLSQDVRGRACVSEGDPGGTSCRAAGCVLCRLRQQGTAYVVQVAICMHCEQTGCYGECKSEL